MSTVAAEVSLKVHQRLGLPERTKDAHSAEFHCSVTFLDDDPRLVMHPVGGVGVEGNASYPQPAVGAGADRRTLGVISVSREGQNQRSGEARVGV